MLKYKIIIILFLLILPTLVSALTVEPNVLFKIKYYNTYLQFEKEANIKKIVLENDKILIDSCTFSLIDGNVTFRSFFENNNLTFYLYGIAGKTSIITISSLQKPSNIYINGSKQDEGTTWFYNPSTKTLTINYTF